MVHFLVLHVTVMLIVAFFILFAASKADGIVRLFGNILGAWVILVAILHIVAFFVPGMMGMKPGMMHEGMMHNGMMHEHWMHQWGGGGQQMVAPVTPAPATVPAKAATPAPATPPAPKKP